MLNNCLRDDHIIMVLFRLGQNCGLDIFLRGDPDLLLKYSVQMALIAESYQLCNIYYLISFSEKLLCFPDPALHLKLVGRKAVFR